jgi:hypothetical protein
MNSLLPELTAPLLDRIKTCMVGLKMPRAIEVVDALTAQGCSVLSYIGHFGDLAEAAKCVGVAVLAD